MDKSKLPYFLSILNKQIEDHEVMLSHFWEIEAMFHPLLGGHLHDFPIAMLHDYIGIMRAMAIKARKLNEHLIKELIDVRKASIC